MDKDLKRMEKKMKAAGLEKEVLVVLQTDALGDCMWEKKKEQQQR